MSDVLERIKPYGKHNIYVKIYELDEHRSVSISDAKWIVCSYEGFEKGVGVFNPNPSERADVIALILNDEKNRFFPVISFLTREEALRLALDLLKLLTGKNEAMLMEVLCQMLMEGDLR